MHTLDIILLTILAVTSLWGAVTGLLWQLSWIATVVLGVYCSVTFHEATTNLLATHVMQDASPFAVGAIAYVSLFVGVFLLMLVITLALGKYIKENKLEWLNRVLGMVLAGGTTAMLLGSICWVFSHVPIADEWVKGSKIGPALAQTVETVAKNIPEERRQDVQQAGSKLQETVKDQVKTKTASAQEKQQSKADPGKSPTVELKSSASPKKIFPYSKYEIPMP
ncbi:MAG: CvpA family protein [Gemmataceae bacterium]